MKMLPAIIFVLTLLILANYSHAQERNNEEKDYKDFINLFLPSNNMVFIFNFTPEKIVMHPGEIEPIKFQIIKMNSSVRIGFYIRMIISSSDWEPEEYYLPEYQDMWHRIHYFNDWLCNTWPLTTNVYWDNFRTLHFRAGMNNLTATFKFTVYQRTEIHITVIARPENKTLWVPVGGYGNIKIIGDIPLYQKYSLYMYPFAADLIILFTTAFLHRRFKRRGAVKKTAK